MHLHTTSLPILSLLTAALNYVPKHADLNYISTTLITAVQSICIQLVPCVTAADEASNGVSTTVFTATILNVAFIDVYVTTGH